MVEREKNQTAANSLPALNLNLHVPKSPNSLPVPPASSHLYEVFAPWLGAAVTWQKDKGRARQGKQKSLPMPFSSYIRDMVCLNACTSLIPTYPPPSGTALVAWPDWFEYSFSNLCHLRVANRPGWFDLFFSPLSQSLLSLF